MTIFGYEFTILIALINIFLNEAIALRVKNQSEIHALGGTKAHIAIIFVLNGSIPADVGWFIALEAAIAR